MTSAQVLSICWIFASVGCIGSDSSHKISTTSIKSELMNDQDNLSTELLKKLDAAIIDWSKQDLAPATVWTKYGVHMSQEVYYNKDFTRALMLFAYDSGKNVTTKLMPAELIDERWMFHPRLGMTFKSAYHNDKPEIDFYVKRAIARLEEDGLKVDEKVDSNYVNDKWFEENRMDQYDLFLKQEY